MPINQEYHIYHEDCMTGMTRIPTKSIDCIICDLPYGVLNCNNRHAAWDIELPPDTLWKEYRRIIKDNGAIILFGQGMFSARLMTSNPSMWRYNLIWKKGARVSGFLNANRMPLRNHEDIMVFYKKLPVYHPQMTIGKENHGRNTGGLQSNNKCYGNFKVVETVFTNEKYPLSVIDIPKEHDTFYHPTQKPVALIEYLIRTYTDEGAVVLDNCMGSGTTGVACMNTGRRFIGFEKEKSYFDIATERIEKAQTNKTQHEYASKHIRPTEEYFKELFRVSKNQIIWGGNYFPLPPTRCFVCWDKQQVWENFSQCELAWTSFDKPAKHVTIPNRGGQSDHDKFHPTQKPIDLYAYLLRTFARPGDKILDTHLGSGSSRIAAYKMGFDFYATEIDEEYFVKQEKRFRKTCLGEVKTYSGEIYRQGTLFE